MSLKSQISIDCVGMYKASAGPAICVTIATIAEAGVAGSRNRIN